MSGKRKKYTPEFREQAARLVIETGRPIAHVAAEIGVGEQLLGRWVRLAQQRAGGTDTDAVLDADERAELERLRKENAELRLDTQFNKSRESGSDSRLLHLVERRCELSAGGSAGIRAQHWRVAGFSSQEGGLLGDADR
jgi:transposase